MTAGARRPDALTALWRACARRDRGARSAAAFIVAYVAIVVAFGAGVSGLIERMTPGG